MGWYASATPSMPLIADTSSLIHDFYSSETDDGDPIHLVVDTRLLQDRLTLRAYQSTSVLLENEPLANLFHQVKLQLQSNEAESICLNEMLKTQERGGGETVPTQDTAAVSAETTPDTPDTSAAALQVSMEKLLGLLETASTHVDGVVDGKVAPDVMIGRQIADTLASVPRIRPEVFDRLFHDSLQDLLMVTYLSNITRTQLAIAEKLNATLGV